jgi:hypothetical protein
MNLMGNTPKPLEEMLAREAFFRSIASEQVGL